MPTYEYECTKCGHRFENFQSITSKPLSRCPECKGKVRRLISGGSGLIFKGSGFYITENRSAGYKEKARTEGGGADKPGGGGDKSGGGAEKSGGGGDKSGGGGKKSGGNVKPAGPPRAGGAEKSGGAGRSGGESGA